MSETAVRNVRKNSHKVLAVVDLLMGIACGAIAVYLLYLTRTPKMLADPNATDVIRGMKVAVVVLGIPAVLYVVCSVGLFKGMRWAWWASLVLNLGFVVAICEDVVSDWPHADTEDITLAVVVALALLLQLTHALWRWMRSRREHAEPAVSQ